MLLCSHSTMLSKLVLIFSLLVAVAWAQSPYLGFRLPIFRNGAKIEGRVTGGSNASPGEFPHQVSLQWGFPPILPLSHMCGASILNERWILTAAHCPAGIPFGKLYVKAGKHNIRNREKSEQTVVVQKSFIHPKYPGAVAPYDIALLKLKTPLVLNDLVQAISLPEPEVLPEGDVVLSGWGSTSTSSVPMMPSILQKVLLSIVDLDTCRTAIEQISGSAPLDETNVCTGPLTGGLSACSGDSGGPLIQTNRSTGNSEIIGIVSWGIVPCGTVGAPSVYTRVSAHIPWINSVIQANS